MAQGTWDKIFDGPPAANYGDGRISDNGVSRGRHKNDRAQSSRTLPRDDIQGLRAVAVIAVVANHLTNHPRGGFVGVDVFFVISGYLITGLLVREGERTGSISWLGFYKRRVRRLIPAALTVTVATLIAAHYIFNSQRFHDTAYDAFFATVFAANWRLIHTGTDYFQAQHAVSPMQHYWSLSVEEQFYFVWPLVLLAVFAVCKKKFSDRPHAARTAGLITAGTLTLASLVVAAQQTNSNAVVAYFSTFTRGWELGLGALLAVGAKFVRGSRLFLTLLSWLGMVLIFASFFVVTQQHFPFPGAILPCVGSALVLGAATENRRAANIVLANPVARYLGDISYSIYLVHFPVIIFAGALVTDRSVAFYVLTAVMALGLSVLLYEVLEDPIRKSGWLRGGQREVDDRAEPRSRTRPSVAGAGLALLALAAFVLIGPSSSGTLQKITDALSTSSTTGSAQAHPHQDALTTEIAQALKATTWPKLNPPLDRVVQGVAETANCATKTLPPASRCSWGASSAKRTIYMVGDSTSLAYSDAFIKLVANFPGWRVRVAGGAGCAFSSHPLNTWCPARNAQVIADVKAVRPAVLVVTDVNGRDGYAQQTAAELDKVRGSAAKIVVLPAPPEVKSVGQCYTKQSSPIDCVSQVSDDYRHQLSNEQALAKQFGANFIDPTPWVCAHDYCPVFVGHISARRDQFHITPQYAAFIAPVVQEALVADSILPAPLSPELAGLRRELTLALKAKTWPAIQPAPGDEVPGQAERSGCPQHEGDVARCTFGDKSAKKSIYLVGDSTSVAYEDAFVELVKSLPGWRVRMTGGAGCPFADTTLNEDAGNQFKGSCPARNAAIVREINRVRPDVVIETSASGDTNYQLHVGNELKKIKSSVGTIVILPAPPQGDDPSVCFTKVSTPSDCVSHVGADYRSQLDGESRMASALGGQLIDPTDWYAVNGFSPMFVGHTPLRWDKIHIAPQYAAHIAPVVREALVEAGVFSRGS